MQLAASRGYTHVGLVDWCSVAGAVELCEAAREQGVGAVIGATLPILLPTGKGKAEAFPLVLLAQNRTGYQALNELISTVRQVHPEGLPLEVLFASDTADLVCLTGGRTGFPTVLGERRELPVVQRLLTALRPAFQFRLYVQLFHGAAPHEQRRLSFLRGLAREQGLPTVAVPEICMGEANEYPLLDALTCARLGIDVNTPHAERPRNHAPEVAFPLHWGMHLPYPDALLNAANIARDCTLDLLPERLTPPEPKLPEGVDAQTFLERRVRADLPRKYPAEVLEQADQRLTAELVTVAQLDMAGFFLTAAEVTDHCREHGILAAGRGSAAGSVLCYLLGITLSDPIRHNLLFERFLHTGRSSMPDVDIDIASSRRDSVLAWVEERWGTNGGEAMVANRITYRLPSAVQDLGRALGLPPEVRDRLSRALGRDFRHLRPHRAREAEVVFAEVLGSAPVKDGLLELLERIEPRHVRHMAPHSGGTVLSAKPLTYYSPLQRSTGGIRLLFFDKDDVERLGLIKLDLLGLRMLAALERAREEVLRLTGQWVEYGELPDDPQVWARIASGDTLGLFQIESPAQVQMTARLQPKNLTELAHQIALVRPGPIQSGTVHPYVRRARGEEAVPVLPEPLHTILAPTHGTLMFQEQILRIAVHYAGYDWPQADRFRSRLSKVEDDAELVQLRAVFVKGAARTTGAFPWEAKEIFALCAMFRGYGFAESHAHAFAQHSYASAWMRHHHPAAFLAGLLTEAPGMWPASTLAQEARRWGVTLSPIDVNRSGMSFRAERERSVRVPLKVDGLGEEAVRRIVQERLVRGRFQSVEDLYDRVAIQRGALETLVQAGAFDGLGVQRRGAFYTLTVLANARPPGQRALLTPTGESPFLPELSEDELLSLDLCTKGYSEAGRHPLDAHRARLRDLGCIPLSQLRHGQQLWTAGLVIAWQRPPTAKGFAFFVLEDRHTRVQLIISPDLWEAHRQLLRDASALIAFGEARTNGRAVTLKALRLAGLPIGTRRARV
ncbi:error-prone DNA polymerase [Deinococcus ruber]|uniref:DNA-directed DNA polymerase n=1 Tax=Deinococcus ruber TaxID=1848197 RepID=A0A918F835_9DEIO|nr:error-prone DNA polymerase [Deinococcus ruber]